MYWDYLLFETLVVCVIAGACGLCFALKRLMQSK